jgi:predicted nucleic acid-binding protein
MNDLGKSRHYRKRVIVDASSAIILFKSGLFLQLIQYYQTLMTDSVYSEVTCKGYPGAEDFIKIGRDRSMTVVSCKGNIPAYFADDHSLFILDRGERETIACLIGQLADFIIIDDGRGSRYCRDNNLPFINALLFPKILLLKGLLTTATYEEKMTTIINNGRYSNHIVECAKRMRLKQLKIFLP